MNSKSIKRKIKAMWMSVALIVVAAVLTQLISFYSYTYTKRTVEWKTKERTQQNLKELERINEMKARVETAVTANIGTVEGSLKNPSSLYDICANLVGRNKHIIGSAVALKPGFVAQADYNNGAFAAFAFQTSDNTQVRTKQLPYDYEKSEWYEHPMKNNCIWWSQPYRDTGGSDMLIYTFSAPLHDYKNECIGVFTADVNYEEMVFRTGDEEADYQRLGMWILLSQLLCIALIVIIVWRSASSIRRVNKLMTDQELMNRELKIAGDIQRSMLPTTQVYENKKHHLDIGVNLLSASDISADFYDYFYTSHSLVFCLGDVPGSNVRASLMMAVVRSVFRTAATAAEDAAESISPVTVVKAMNRSFCSMLDNQMFTTLLVGVLDLNTMQLTYCNAGHPCPVVLSPKNGIRLLCVNPNVPVGVVDDYEFKEEYASLLTGDMVFLYTDGLIETENATHEVFGTKRMMLCLEKSLENGGTPEQIIERMTNNVEKFRANADRIDDAVMVVIKTL